MPTLFLLRDEWGLVCYTQVLESCQYVGYDSFSLAKPHYGFRKRWSHLRLGVVVARLPWMGPDFHPGVLLRFQGGSQIPENVLKTCAGLPFSEKRLCIFPFNLLRAPGPQEAAERLLTAGGSRGTWCPFCVEAGACAVPPGETEGLGQCCQESSGRRGLRRRSRGLPWCPHPPSLFPPSMC